MGTFFRRSISIICLFMLAVAMVPAPPAHATSGETLCFAGKTRHCISGRLLDYWRQNGGLAVFGYPITAVRDERNRDTGQSHLTQWFERARFELHPNNPAPYDVLLGRLGDDLLAERGVDWRNQPGANGVPPANCHAFDVSRLSIFVCDQASGKGFRTYWQSHGLELGDAGVSERESLALFGLPLTMPRMETNTSGNRVLTQWFERARFERHPGNPDRFKVLLGLLGNEVSGGVRYFWPKDLPSGLAIRLERSSADETGFSLELSAIQGPSTTIGIAGGRSSPAGEPPRMGEQAEVTVRGRAGTAYVVSGSYTVIWVEGDVPYAVIGARSLDEALRLANGLEPLSLSAWKVRLAAIAAGGETDLLLVESIEVLITETYPSTASVRVQGLLADSCTSLGSIHQSRAGNVIAITVTTKRTNDHACTQVVREVEQTIRLEGIFPPGAYTVRVNDREQHFQI